MDGHSADLLRNRKVCYAIAEELDRMRARDPDWIRTRLCVFAATDMSDFLSLNDAGEVVLDLRKAYDKNALAGIAKVRTGEGGKITAFELRDPHPFLQTLAKAAGLLPTETQAAIQINQYQVSSMSEEDLVREAIRIGQVGSVLPGLRQKYAKLIEELTHAQDAAADPQPPDTGNSGEDSPRRFAAPGQQDGDTGRGEADPGLPPA
jgi:hypothetical protein